VMASAYVTPLSSIIFCADDVPSLVRENPSVRWPLSVAFHLMSDVVPVDLDVILIPLCDGWTGRRTGIPFSHLWLIM
jgi:hypothetical protein